MSNNKKCCEGKRGCNADAKIETVVSCKATAALKQEVEQELNEQDKPIEEIISNAEDKE